MKKIKYFAFLMGILIIGIPMAKADCSIEEQNRVTSLAYKVNANFEVISKEVPLGEGMFPPDGLTQEEIDNYKFEKKFFKVYISNITEDLYIVVKNNKDNTSKTYRYSDAENNVISFEKDVTGDITNYTITVYAANGECSGKSLNTINLTLPMYNKYSAYVLCDGIEEYYLCKEYISVETSFDGFFDKAQKYKDSKFKESEKEKDEEKGLSKFIKEHKGIIIVTSIIVIVIGGVVTVIIVKKQRSRIV